jgi:DNA-binding XRE family transcriptional regulator
MQGCIQYQSKKKGGRFKGNDVAETAGRVNAIDQEGNNVRRIRDGLLISRAELARRAAISPITLDRVEKGHPCRVDTKRKIILALGLKLSDRDKVFPPDGR